MCEQYFQYILSVNQSTLDLLAKELSEEEYKALISRYGGFGVE